MSCVCCTCRQNLSQACSGADITAQACVTLLLILSELSALQEVHLIKILVIALFVRLQLILHLCSNELAGKKASSYCSSV